MAWTPEEGLVIEEQPEALEGAIENLEVGQSTGPIAVVVCLGMPEAQVEDTRPEAGLPLPEGYSGTQEGC